MFTWPYLNIRRVGRIPRQILALLTLEVEQIVWTDKSSDNLFVKIELETAKC